MHSISIQRVSNGFLVTFDDPKIMEENRKPQSRYRDPTRKLVFKTVNQVTKFIRDNVEVALPVEEFETSFKMEAAKEPPKGAD